MNPVFAAFVVLGPTGTDVIIDRTDGWSTLRFAGGGSFRSTHAEVRDVRTVRTGGVTVVLWDELDSTGIDSYSAVSLKPGSVERVAEVSKQLHLRFGSIDPMTEVAATPVSIPVSPDNQIFVVQFESQILGEYRDVLARDGAEVLNYLPDNAYVVRVRSGSIDSVRGHEFVRWAGPLEPSWCVDPLVQQGLAEGTLAEQNYWIQVVGDDSAEKAQLARGLVAAGATNVDAPAEGSIIELTMKPDVVRKAAALNGVLWIQPKGEPTPDMDNVRIVSGANYVEPFGPYRGAGVTMHDIDGGIRRTHQAYASRLTVRGNPPVDSHGTATAGIVFGNGAANAAGKGMMPEANLVLSAYTVPWNGAARLAWTQDTVNVHKCVVETNSWGDPRTLGIYDAVSSYMDEIIFKTDLLICQSMSNAGSRDGRPQAWAKNIVSIGATNHFGNTNLADDRWNNGATIGPAADNRMKPELCFYYDSILTTTSTNDTAYTTSFGGTSAATPMTAGAFGLFMEMWGKNGEFGNTNLGATVFDNRPHSSLAKAIATNTATLYPQGQADINRNVQGWGIIQLQNMFDGKQNMFWVNETDLLQNLQTKTYRLYVAPGTPMFKATMAFTDLWGAALANPAAVNRLSLRVDSPTGTFYYGNNGMTGVGGANTTTAGGAPDALNQIQQVFVANPQSGIWTVTVKAEALVQDGHVETTALDADYALCVSGVKAMLPVASVAPWRPGSIKSGGVAEVSRSDNSAAQLTTPLLPAWGVVAESGVVGTFTSPTGTLSTIDVSAEGRTNLGNIPWKMYLRNFSNNTWEQVANGTAPNVDGLLSATPAGDPSRFVEAGTNSVRLAIVFERDTSGLSATQWQSSVDHMRVIVQP